MNALGSWMLAYLLNSLWQVPLVFVAAWAAVRLARPFGPREEHRIWVVALLLQTALPACSFRLDELWRRLSTIFQWATSGAATDGHTRVSIGPATASAIGWLHLPAWLIETVTVAYACTILYFAGRLAWGVFRMHAMQRHAQPIILTGAAAKQWQDCAESFGIDPQTVAVATSEAVSGPVTVGIFKQALLVPPDFLTGVSGVDLDAVLAHECAHMRRRDFAQNLLYRVISLPVDYHPLLWLTGSRLAESREILCDRMAAEAIAGPESYARSLLRLASLLCEPVPATTLHAIGFFDANIFERRVMSLTRKRVQMKSAQRFVIAAACGVIALATCASALALHMDVSTPADTSGVNTAKRPLHVKVAHLEVLTRVPPVYPVEAKVNKDTLDGPVVLAVTVGKDGRPEAIRVLKSLRGDYDSSALDAVKQWLFAPYLLNGTPVEVETSITVTYKLGG